MTDTVNIIDTTGARLYIGPKGYDTKTEVKALSPDPFVEVGEVQSFGSVTFAANQVRSTALNRIDDTVNKGVIPQPIIPIVFNKLAGDDGQEAMQDAFDDRSGDQFYWLKLVLPDTPNLGTSPEGTPTTFYWKGKVLEFTPIGAIAVDGTVQGATSVSVVRTTWSEEPAAE